MLRSPQSDPISQSLLEMPQSPDNGGKEVKVKGEVIHGGVRIDECITSACLSVFDIPVCATSAAVQFPHEHI